MMRIEKVKKYTFYFINTYVQFQQKFTILYGARLQYFCIIYIYSFEMLNSLIKAVQFAELQFPQQNLRTSDTGIRRRKLRICCR